ncbi:MAG TPA: hypothetical protein VEA41_01105 [Salinarimonas sp.]|nr:hypothetical protein [Salinarimonas sp.]
MSEPRKLEAAALPFVTRADLEAECLALEKQEQAARARIAEAQATLQQIGGALRMARHLLGKIDRRGEELDKQIAADRAEAEALAGEQN